MAHSTVTYWVDVQRHDGSVVRGKLHKLPVFSDPYPDYEVLVDSVELGLPGPHRMVGLRTTLVDGVMRERSSLWQSPAPG